MRAGMTVAMVLLSVVVARADSSDDAKKLFEHGTAQYALHHFPEAASDFEKAFELRPDPAILYNAAQAHRFAGNKKRALELYESYVRLYGNQPNAGEATEHAAQLRAALEAEQKATNAPPAGTAPLSATPGAAEPSSQPSAATLTATPSEKPSRPLIKKPWFWAVIGGAAVVAATGIALGVTLGSSKKDPVPTYGVANGN